LGDLHQTTPYYRILPPVIRQFIKKNEQKVRRALEIAPGVVIWAIILFPIVGSFFVPHIVAYFLIAFYVYWLYRSVKLAVFGLSGYLKIRKAEETDWREKYIDERDSDSLNWDEIRHVVLIPTAGEPVETLMRNIDALAAQTFDRRKIFVVLAMEERIKGAEEVAAILSEKYKDTFGSFWVTFHPGNLSGEVVGKASNETWAAKRAREKILALGWDLDNLTLTSCDADARFHPKYFEALTYAFADDPERYFRFWQSPIFWYNNIWRVPAFVKVVGILGGVMHIADLQEPTRLLFNYSCYSASFSMVDRVGYWDTDIIPEDWHLFLQSFFALGGRVVVEPIYLPTSIDAPEAGTYLGSLKSRYQQCKRHAWGATDIPYAVLQFFEHPEIPFLARLFRVFKLVETHILWSTNWFLITLGASIPPLLNPAFEQTSLGQNLPQVSRTILTASLFGLGAVLVLDAALRPPKPKDAPWWTVPAYYLQWFLMPVATFFMACLPALDSHTSLMRGKRLEYRVTEKV